MPKRTKKGNSTFSVGTPRRTNQYILHFLPDPDPLILEITDPDPTDPDLGTEKGDNQKLFFFSM